MKIKVESTNHKDEEKSFDYTFDYILAGSEPKKLSEVTAIVGKGIRATRKIAEDNQYTITQKNGEDWINDFPADPIVIVEVMTSSTSGGDKKKRTQIAMACEDAIIPHENHNGLGINYHQVWARMVSQLIVKSQVGIAWNGKTFWLVQDVLAQYISSTTALDLSKYTAQLPNEVNVIAFGYGDVDRESTPTIIELNSYNFYAGTIMGNSNNSNSQGFIEIVKIAATPEKNHLWHSLLNKTPCSNISP